MPIPTKPSPCVGIRTCSDYSPFGVELDGRTVSGGYRFGYQGSEKDNELKGNGNSYQMVTGRKQETLTFKGTKQLVKSCGASEHRAEDIATFVDCSLYLGLGTAALVKQSMTRVAPMIMADAAKSSTTVIDGAVKSNYGRFVSKIPANSKKKCLVSKMGKPTRRNLKYVENNVCP
jgi:hypothetical protein